MGFRPFDPIRRRAPALCLFVTNFCKSETIQYYNIQHPFFSRVVVNSTAVKPVPASIYKSCSYRILMNVVQLLIIHFCCIEQHRMVFMLPKLILEITTALFTLCLKTLKQVLFSTFLWIFENSVNYFHCGKALRIPPDITQIFTGSATTNCMQVISHPDCFRGPGMQLQSLALLTMP